MKPLPTVLLLMVVMSWLLGCGPWDSSSLPPVAPGTGWLYVSVNDGLRGARTLVPPIVMKAGSEMV